MRSILTCLCTALWLSFAGSFASADQEPCCRTLFGNIPDEEMERGNIGSHFRMFFRNGEFGRIEELAETIRREKTRTGSGVWALTMMYSGILETGEVSLLWPNAREELIMDGLDHWTVVERLIDMWMGEFPDSATAHMVRAQALYEQARNLRGSSLNQNTTLATLMAYRWYMESTRKYLDDHRDVAERDIHWYALRAIVGAFLGETFEEVMVYAIDGIEQEPYYYQLWFNVESTLFPRFGGDPRKLDAFANMAAEATRDIDGDAMYARIYWYASQIQWGSRTFQVTDVDWERMKSGMEDVIRRYPHQWNIQHFANFACYAGDYATTRRYVEMIGDNYIIRKAWWGGEPVYEECKDLAIPPS